MVYRLIRIFVPNQRAWQAGKRQKLLPQPSSFLSHTALNHSNQENLHIL